MNIIDKNFLRHAKDALLVHCKHFFPFIGLICTFTLSGQLIHQGHAHNDYEHEKPLFSALSYGFTSIEVDIHAYGGVLKVSHDFENCENKPNLEELYIKPLDSIVQRNNGCVYDIDSSQLTLMIDLKSKPEQSLNRLNKLLKNYDHLFQKYENGKTKWGPIIILISGEPPMSTWQSINSPYLYLDGRASKIYPPNVRKMIRRISGNIFTVCSNSALLEGHPVEIEKLSILVSDLYNQGAKEVRFWSTTDRPEVWQSLLNAGVNIISVDDLQGFSNFISAQK